MLDVHAGRVNIPGKTLIDTKAGKEISKQGQKEEEVILQDFGQSSRRDQCSVNPVYGRAHLLGLFRAPDRRKKVAVIGGGPAGCQAAIILAQRGHDVVLYEKSGELGGQLKLMKDVQFKVGIAKYRDYLETQVRKNKIYVKLNTEANPELLRAQVWMPLL